MAVDKSKLEKIAGKKNVLDDEATLKQFSQDQSFVAPRRPDAVVYVDTVEKVQQIVKLANETLTPIVPFSSGLTLRGAAIHQRVDSGNGALPAAKTKKKTEKQKRQRRQRREIRKRREIRNRRKRRRRQKNKRGGQEPQSEDKPQPRPTRLVSLTCCL